MIENANELQEENGGKQSNASTSGRLKGISKEEISGQGILFFIAGYDTTNATLCHVLYHLVRYSDWQDRLHAELTPIEDRLDYEVLRDLPVLNAVINETLRLCPPLIFIQRCTAKDTTLLDTGIKLEKNTILTISPYVIHRNPEYFPDPESFKPERFMDKSTENHIAFMPFGVGPRLCVGMRFALNELRLGVANLILRYRLLPDPNLEVSGCKFVSDFVLANTF
mgnify:CR=1 FL=1